MTQNQQPTFSIIIPTYNRARLLPRAITSILRQTVTDFELIIVDDGSTDETRQVIQAFKDPRLKYIYQENSGAAVARNRGVIEAKGRYVTFLDSDDEALPEWLAEVGAAIQLYQAAIICCGVIQTFEQHQPPQEEVCLPRGLGRVLANQQGLFITGGTFTVKAEVFRAVGGYASECRAGQHTELSWRLAPYCNQHGLTIHNIMKPLIRRHVHDGPSIRKDWSARLQGVLYFLQHHSVRLAQYPPGYSRFWAMAGVAAIRLNQSHQARHYFKSAIQTYPWNWKNYVRFLMTFSPTLAHSVWLYPANDD